MRSIATTFASTEDYAIPFVVSCNEVESRLSGCSPHFEDVPLRHFFALHAIALHLLLHIGLMAEVVTCPGRSLFPEPHVVRSKTNIVDEFMSASKAALFKTACGIVDDKIGDSKVFDSTVEDRVPRFSKEELRLGRLLHGDLYRQS